MTGTVDLTGRRLDRSNAFPPLPRREEATEAQPSNRLLWIILGTILAMYPAYFVGLEIAGRLGILMP
jgi:hypothetical protein